MDATCPRRDCAGCPAKVVCHCLQVTEETLRHALATLDIRTVKDIRYHTGAGDGCTACHRLLRKYLPQTEEALVQSSSASPI